MALWRRRIPLVENSPVWKLRAPVKREVGSDLDSDKAASEAFTHVLNLGAHWSRCSFCESDRTVHAFRGHKHLADGTIRVVVLERCSECDDVRMFDMLPAVWAAIVARETWEQSLTAEAMFELSLADRMTLEEQGEEP